MWQIITAELVEQRATTIETGVVATLGTSGGNNALMQCITSACDEVRMAVLQGGTNLDERENSVPPSLVNCALSIIVYHLASRGLSDSLLVQSSRYQEYANALKLLDDVRNRRVRVEDPQGDVVGISPAQISKSAPRPRFSGIEML